MSSSSNTDDPSSPSATTASSDTTSLPITTARPLSSTTISLIITTSSSSSAPIISPTSIPSPTTTSDVPIGAANDANQAIIIGGAPLQILPLHQAAGETLMFRFNLQCKSMSPMDHNDAAAVANGYASNLSAGYGYSSDGMPLDAPDAPTAAAMAAGLLPSNMQGMGGGGGGSKQPLSPYDMSPSNMDSYGGRSLSRSGSMRSPSVIPPPGAVMTDSYGNRSLSFSAANNASNRPTSAMSNLRRPSLPGSGTTPEPYQNIELISAYKTLISPKRRLSFNELIPWRGSNQLVVSVSEEAGVVASYLGSMGSGPINMARRPSTAEEAQQSGGPELETFSLHLETIRWVFARRSSYGGTTGTSAAPSAAYIHLSGGNASVPGGGWGVATERRGIFTPIGQPLPNPSGPVSVMSSSVSVNSSNLAISTSGRVVLMDTNVITSPTAPFPTDAPYSPMMDLLNDPTNSIAPTPLPPASSSGGSSFGSLPRRPSNHTTNLSLKSPTSPRSRSIKDQVHLSLSWKDTSLSLRSQQTANDAIEAQGGIPPPQPHPRLKPSPLRFLVANADSKTPPSLPSTPRPAQRHLQELCVTLSTLSKSATPIPARIGYEPRAFNEVAMKRHDIIILFHRFDADFGYGINRTTGALGFINLSHLDPRRLAVASNPPHSPSPYPSPHSPPRHLPHSLPFTPPTSSPRRPSHTSDTPSSHILTSLSTTPSSLPRHNRTPSNPSAYQHFTPPPPTMVPFGMPLSPTYAARAATTAVPMETRTGSSVSNLLEMLDQSASLVQGPTNAQQQECAVYGARADGDFEKWVREFEEVDSQSSGGVAGGMSGL
ncbi:hypothetical protein BC829DRAFT_442249 [Chytridium lagenaria]|nr:hypothetical protein BC829DRAFT_442249 [Chytridium lagenaria]